MPRLALILICCLALAAPAWAGWDEGVAAYKRGDYETALLEFRPLAEQGDARAQTNLGDMYANGLGAPQDYAEAAKWFRLAAEQGDAHTQGHLGDMYADGRGVAQDYAEALKWSRLAAEQGEPIPTPICYNRHSLGGATWLAKSGNGWKAWVLVTMPKRSRKTPSGFTCLRV